MTDQNRLSHLRVLFDFTGLMQKAACNCRWKRKVVGFLRKHAGAKVKRQTTRVNTNTGKVLPHSQ